jgi:hypothetical protein
MSVRTLLEASISTTEKKTRGSYQEGSSGEGLCLFLRLLRNDAVRSETI